MNKYKHLFKEGKFVEIGGIKRIEFYGINEEADFKFQDSVYRMSSLVGLYDYKKLEGTDYYYIYKAYGVGSPSDQNGSTRMNPNTVANSLKKILDGNNGDVINYEDLTLGCGFSEIENDIFWDVNNNIIFTKGEEALRDMCVYLLMRSVMSLGVERTKETEEEYISKAIDVPMIAKLYNLDSRPFAENNSKKIKLLYN